MEEGECVASRETQFLHLFRKGEYFGELGLLRDQPRAASIIAKVPFFLS